MYDVHNDKEEEGISRDLQKNWIKNCVDISMNVNTELKIKCKIKLFIFKQKVHKRTIPEKFLVDIVGERVSRTNLPY